jgi:glucokinase
LYVLTGDIGGTNTRLALGSAPADRVSIEHRETFASPDYAGLEAIIRDYRPAQQTAVTTAAFGVAGPVRQGVSRITNLPWEISADRLRRRLGLEAVYLLNDLEALAWGIDTLAANELVSLQDGNPEAGGNRAVIAAGTGLGQAGLFSDGHTWRPFATEGGHADFAPESEQEWLLLKHLQQRHAHVSWERVLSGPGIVSLYEFTLRLRKAQIPDWLTDPDAVPAAQITTLALQQGDALCVETLNWYVQLYGREAGNLALKMNATGGVYLGGGIAAAILPALQDGQFIEAFLSKGRMRPLLEGVAVRVICSDLVALQGLTRYALQAVAGPGPI